MSIKKIPVSDVGERVVKAILEQAGGDHEKAFRLLAGRFEETCDSLVGVARTMEAIQEPWQRLQNTLDQMGFDERPEDEVQDYTQVLEGFSDVWQLAESGRKSLEAAAPAPAQAEPPRPLARRPSP